MTQTFAPLADSDSTPPTLTRVFMAAVRAEWTKLLTVRSTLWALILTLVSMIGLGALLTALEVGRWDSRTVAEAAEFDPVLYSLAGINLAQLSIGVLGVLVMTSEYGTGGIKLTLGATPQRRLLLAAKVTAFSSVVAAVGLISCLCSFLLCQTILTARHADVALSDPAALRALLGAVGYLVVIGAIAVAVGTILRRTAGAVALLFAVLLVVPGLLTLLPAPWDHDITKYLPSSAGAAMAAVVHFPTLLSPVGGLLVLCAYTAAISIIAAAVLVHRDV